MPNANSESAARLHSSAALPFSVQLAIRSANPRSWEDVSTAMFATYSTPSQNFSSRAHAIAAAASA